MAAGAAAPDTDRLVHWLVSSMEWHSTVFHLGQYCGAWRASTADRFTASFHLVLRGHCFLHLEGEPSIALGPRDGVFFLRDRPHFLSPHRDAQQACAPRPMEALIPERSDGTSLACGFFEFGGAFSELMVNSFPDYVILRGESDHTQPVGRLFDLMLDEAAQHAEQSSPLVERLTDLLFFYVMRQVAHTGAASGLWALARSAEWAPLIEQLLREPGRDWSVSEMARLVNMSRARFCRHFAQTCGQPPAQFLLLLRMQVAAQRLQRGESVAQAGEHVGYQSYAAFSRAFKKVLGEQPGAYQRTRRQASADATVAFTH